MTRKSLIPILVVMVIVLCTITLNRVISISSIVSVKGEFPVTYIHQEHVDKPFPDTLPIPGSYHRFNIPSTSTIQFLIPQEVLGPDQDALFINWPDGTVTVYWEGAPTKERIQLKNTVPGVIRLHERGVTKSIVVEVTGSNGRTSLRGGVFAGSMEDLNEKKNKEHALGTFVAASQLVGTIICSLFLSRGRSRKVFFYYATTLLSYHLLSAAYGDTWFTYVPSEEGVFLRNRLQICFLLTTTTANLLFIRALAKKPPSQKGRAFVFFPFALAVLYFSLPNIPAIASIAFITTFAVTFLTLSTIYTVYKHVPIETQVIFCVQFVHYIIGGLEFSGSIDGHAPFSVGGGSNSGSVAIANTLGAMATVITLWVAESRFADSTTRFINSCPDAILEFDSLGWLRTANPRAIALFSKDKSLVRRIEHIKMYIPEHQHPLFRSMTDPNTKDSQVEMLLKLPDESVCPTEMNLYRGPSGHMLFTFKNISAQKTLEAQLYHSARIQSLSDTAESMSSSLCTSLDAIDLQSQRLINAFGDAEKTRILRIQEISQRARTIQQQLDSIHTGTQDSQKQSTSLNGALHSAVKACLPLLPPKIRINSSDLGDKDINVRCAQIELEQLMVNLILNARDAISPNSGTISVVAARKQKSVSITVSDTGPGIPAQHIERIFDPFYTTKMGTQRNGFGLASVKLTVNKLKGTITANNLTTQEGACFVVSLPFD